MGIVLGTVSTSIIRDYMIIDLKKDKVTLLNGDQMTISSTLMFDESVKDRCYELLV